MLLITEGQRTEDEQLHFYTSRRLGSGQISEKVFGMSPYPFAPTVTKSDSSRRWNLSVSQISEREALTGSTGIVFGCAEKAC